MPIVTTSWSWIPICSFRHKKTGDELGWLIGIPSDIEIEFRCVPYRRFKNAGRSVQEKIPLFSHPA